MNICGWSRSNEKVAKHVVGVGKEACGREEEEESRKREREAKKFWKNKGERDGVVCFRATSVSK